MQSEYETEAQLGQYLELHYGAPRFGVANYPAACARRALAVRAGRPCRSALDLGCAVGRSTFELARSFDTVVGVDLSHRFIETAETLRRGGRCEGRAVEEGELTRPIVADLGVLGLSDAATRTAFRVRDAAEVPADPVDLVLAANLIDRMADPGAFLASLHRYLVPGGHVVIASPYTLMEAFTPRAAWLGGFEQNGQPVRVLDGMRKQLEPHFVLEAPPEDVPFVIPETARKHQHTLAELTVWRRITDAA